MNLIQFQDLTNPLDVLRKVTGIQIQEQYNILLRNGWTMGATQVLRVLQATIRLFHGQLVKLLTEYFRANPADLLVSVIPHFNRADRRSLECGLSRTAVRDLDYRPRRFPAAFLDRAHSRAICDLRDEKAVEQARAMGKEESHIFATSGMILRPDFYIDETSIRLRRARKSGFACGHSHGNSAFRRDSDRK